MPLPLGPLQRRPLSEGMRPLLLSLHPRQWMLRVQEARGGAAARGLAGGLGGEAATVFPSTHPLLKARLWMAGNSSSARDSTVTHVPSPAGGPLMTDVRRARAVAPSCQYRRAESL